MKKLGKKTLIISVVSIVLILLVISIVGITIYNTRQSVGFSTLGLSTADMTSNLPSDSPFTGKAWILTVRLGGLGQSAYGTFTPANIESATSGDLKTTKDFTLTVSQQNQECRRPIEQTSLYTPIKNVVLYEWQYIPLIDPCTESEAQSRGYSNILWYSGPTTKLKCWVISLTGEQSPVGSFGSENLRTRMNIDIKAGDRSGSKLIDSIGSSQGAVSDFAYVLWQGNLVTGQTCPSANSYKASYVNGNWRVINSNNYEIYRSQFESTPTDKNNPKLWVDEVNNKATSARQSVSFGNSIESPTSQNSAVLITSLNAPIQNPVLTFYIKASTLGIYTPSPEIQLNSATSDCFITGETGTTSEGLIKITAKNIGTEDGNWNFFGTCDSNAFSITESKEYTFTAGQTKTVILPISGSASKKTTSSCTISAENVRGIKTIKTGVCVTPQITCTANNKFCSVSNGIEVVKKCFSDGATSSIVETCTAGQTCSPTELKCVDNGGGGGLGDWLNDLINSFKNFFKNLTMIFAIIIGLISGIFGSLFSNKIINALKLKNKFTWLINLSIFLILSLGVGFICYIYFWFAFAIMILTLIGFILIKIFL